MRNLLIALLLVPLSACSGLGLMTENAARETAKDAINSVVTDRFPDANPAPVTNCIIDNATREEVFSIARDSLNGVGQETVGIVIDIASRPDTVICFGINALPLIKF